MRKPSRSLISASLVAIGVAILASVSLATTGCDTGSAAEPESGNAGNGNGDPPSGNAAVTYHRDVAPILQKHCQGCHVTGGIAPFALSSYDQARDMAGSIVAATGSRKMPPFGAEETASCSPSRPWKDDLRLSAAELETLKQWQGLGAPEGDPKEAPPPVKPPSMDLEGARKLQPAVGFPMSGTVDKFRCFVIDPQLAATTFVTGTHVIPEFPEVVHHVLVFVDQNGSSRAKADANGQYDCFGGPQLDQTRLLTAWAPGGQPNELPPNVGMPVEAGSLFVMQVHYHSGPGVSSPPDHTAIAIKTTDVLPSVFAFTALIGNFNTAVDDKGIGLLGGPNDEGGQPKFFVPPNASGHTETMQFTVPEKFGNLTLRKLRVLSTASHMHYVGVSEEIHVKRAAPTAAQPADECLLGVPKWDFDWQRQYTYDSPIESLPVLTAGDVLSIGCGYDNTMANPKMGRVLSESGLTAPVPVTLGESTLEEMCLGGFVFLVDRSDVQL